MVLWGRYRGKNALLGFPNEGGRRLGRSFGRVDVDSTVDPLKRSSNLEVKAESVSVESQRPLDLTGTLIGGRGRSLALSPPSPSFTSNSKLELKTHPQDRLSFQIEHDRSERSARAQRLPTDGAQHAGVLFGQEADRRPVQRGQLVLVGLLESGEEVEHFDLTAVKKGSRYQERVS